MILFFIRLALYYLLLVLPLFHPLLAQSYNGGTLGALFLMVPFMALSGYFLPPSRGQKISLGVPLAVLVAGVAIIGINATTMGWFILALWAYLSSWGAFRKKAPFLLYPEPFGIVWILFKQVQLLQTGQAATGSHPLLQGGLILLIFIGFTLALAMIFLISQQGNRNPVKEFLLVGLILLPLIIGALFQESREGLENLIREDTPQGLPPSGGSQGNPDEEGSEGDDSRDGNELKELDASKWNSTGQGSSGKFQQQLVMVVQTTEPQVYLAETYWDFHRPSQGFVPDYDSPLNQLSRSRYLETWTNNSIPSDRGRYQLPVRVFSTLNYPQIPYVPLRLEPMTRSQRYYPLSYEYQSLSAPSRLIPDGQGWDYKPLSESDKKRLEPFLELGLNQLEESRLRSWIQQADPEVLRENPLEAIFSLYSDYQYQVGYSENTSTESLLTFLYDTKQGDCTEFSHTAALMGRLLGIPSRVVTGYLVSRGLQTPAHRQGISRLQETHKGLGVLPSSELYLVTTAHRHAWTQFYLSGFGWVDFETTAYAIPPLPGGDLNQSDVLIPKLTEIAPNPRDMNLPWGLLGQLAGGLFILVLAGQYLHSRIRLLRLSHWAKIPGERGCKAHYAWVLHHYNARGSHQKDPSQTPQELAEKWPQGAAFLSLYTQLLLDPSLNQEEYNTLYNQYLREGRRVVQSFTLKEKGRILFSFRSIP